jgi:LysM repeat protein
MAMELIKENIECEQLLNEDFSDTVVKAEYVIPDTHPDVNEVLMIDAKPLIVAKEVMQDKVLVEGQMEYTILYLAKEEETIGVHSVTYVGKFSNYVEIPGAEHKMVCDADCYVEHMECNIVNERKIAVEGIVKLKAEVYKNYDFEVIKDITGSQDMQMLKNPATVDKIVGNVSEDLVAKSQIQIPMDKPQIGTVLKCDVKVHKKEVRVMEGKISVNAYVLVGVLYRGKDMRELVYVEDNVEVNKEVNLEGVNPTMDSYTDFKVDTVGLDVKEDDLGENRNIVVEAIIKSDSKVMYKEEMDIIQDAYSPSSLMQMDKKDYELNVMHGHSTCQSIVKYNIEMDSNKPKIAQILMNCGKVCITDKKLVEDKVIIDGVLNVDVLYRTVEEDKYVYTVNEEIPFSCAIEIPGCKIDMQCIGKAYLESIDASIEADTIGIKAVVEVYGRVNYVTHKEFLVDMASVEGELPKKKASLTIYAVQHGDTLWKIAKKYASTIDDLVKLNNIEESDVMKVGHKLIIPGRAII